MEVVGVKILTPKNQLPLYAPIFSPYILVTLVYRPRLKLYIKTIMQNKFIVTSYPSVLEVGEVNMLSSFVNFFMNMKRNKMADENTAYEGDKKQDIKNKKTKLGRILMTFALVLGSLCIFVMAWDALDTSRSLHKTMEQWEAEDPHTTTLGQVRQAVSGLWWFGPLKPDAALNPLDVCGVEGESSWWKVFLRLRESKERLSCLQEQVVLAHQEHEDFKTKVFLFSGFVLSVVCFMSCVFGAWWCKGTTKTQSVPVTVIKLEYVIPTMEDEHSSENYNDELFFTPTQGDEEELESDGQESMHVTSPCTQENLIETSVKESVLTTMEVDEVLVNEEVREEDILMSSEKESNEVNEKKGKESVNNDNNKMETQTVTPMDKETQPVSTLKKSPINLKETLQTPSNTDSEVMWTEVKNKKKQRKKRMIAGAQQTAIKQGKTDKRKENDTGRKGETDINVKKTGKENKGLRDQDRPKSGKDVGQGTQNPKSRVSSEKENSEVDEKEGKESVDSVNNKMDTQTVTPINKETQQISTLKTSPITQNDTLQTPSNTDSEATWTEVKNKKKQRKKQMIAETEQTAIQIYSKTNTPQQQGKTTLKQDTGTPDKKKQNGSGRKGETGINVNKSGKENKGLRGKDRPKGAKDVGQGTQNPKSRVARRGPNTGTQESGSKDNKSQLPGSQRKEGSKQGSVRHVKRPDNRRQERNTAARGTSRVMQKKVSSTQVSTVVLVPAQPQPLTKCWAQVVKDPKPEVKVAASTASQKTDIKSRSTKGRASGPRCQSSSGKVRSRSSSGKVAASVASQKTEIKPNTKEGESGTGCRGSTVTSQSSSGKVASPPQAAIVPSEPKAKVKSWADVLKTPRPEVAVSPSSKKIERGLCKEECVSANQGSASGRKQRGSANQRRGSSTWGRGYTTPGRGSSIRRSGSSIQESGSSVQGRGSSIQGRGSSIQGSGSLQSAETACKTWVEEVDETFPVPDECLQYFRTGTEAGSVWHSSVIGCPRARSPSFQG